jgi:dienelactone hydrolase
VLILTSSDGNRSARKTAKAGGVRLEAALAAAGLLVQRLDLSRKSASKGKDSKTSASSKRNAVVKSALDRLAAIEATGDRIAVIAEGKSADVAVLGSRAHSQVRSFVFLSGRLSSSAKETLVEWSDDPVLCVVSGEDKAALRDMADVYLSSKHADTDLRVVEELGSGEAMIEQAASQSSTGEPLEQLIAGWIRRQLTAVGREREVSFTTEDGWEIFGNLLLPDHDGKPAPGAVLLHSGRSDRYVFAGLERLLVREGFAVLNIDWRGRGKSTNKGKYFDLSKEERANGKLDAKAAIDFLTSQAGVDRERVGMVGIVHGAEHAVRGSIGDSRVKALALLTGYVPMEQGEREYLISGNVHILYVTCTGHHQVTKTMRGLYEATPSKLARLLVYDGGAIGYQLFELDSGLEPSVVEWLKAGVAEKEVSGSGFRVQGSESG